MKRLIVLGAAGGLMLLLQGCAVDTGDIGTDEVGTTTQRTVCGTDDHGKNATMAALAVAMAEELGELDPVRQLEPYWDGSYQKLRLKAGVCPGSCPKTNALLDLQDESWQQVFPQETFNAIDYRSTLVAKLEEQKNWEINLLQNQPGLLPGDHKLSMIATSDGACGVDYTFEVTNPTCTSAASLPIYEIKNVNSNKCIDIAWGSKDAGANAQQYDCYRGAAQQFVLEDLGNGYKQIKNVNSGKCLDVSNWSTADGANVQQWDCTGGNNQQFQVVDAGSGKKGLINRHSGKGLEISAFSTANGGNVAQWTYYSSNANKVFYLNQIGTTSNDCTYSGSTEYIKNRLIMFGGDANPYLAFNATDTTISIDPDYADSGEISTSDNAATCDATALCRVWDPNYTRSGCCTCTGVSNGTWGRYARNPGYAICK